MGVLKSFLFGLSLIAILSFSGCTGEEQEVMPQQTCDTQATVQNLPACGLVLMLDNNQILVPINATTLPQQGSGGHQFKINGFTVKENQQVIIGYNKKGLVDNACGGGGQLAEITCIVGYQAQP